MNRRLFAILLAVTSLLALAATAEAATRVYFAGAGGGPKVRPRTVYLSADGTLDVYRVRWRSWGGASATGRGTAAYHGCTPSCAAGKSHSTVVTVTMSDPVTCRGRRYYNDVALRNRAGRSLFRNDLRLDHWAPCRS